MGLFKENTMSEKNNNRVLKRVIFALTSALFLFSAFHAFFVTWFRHLGLSGIPDKIISSWREILLIVLFVYALPLIKNTLLLREKRLIFIKDNFFPLLFFFTAFVFAPFQDNLSQWLWGARYDLLPFFALFVFQFFDFSDKQLQKLLKMILGAGLFITAFGFVHALILPQDFMTVFGYSINRDIWDINIAISSCQFLEHTQNFCRAVSVFGGPTRYGTYLLLLLPLSIWAFLKTEKRSGKIFLGLLSMLALANIFLTYSRSIWAGLLIMIVAALLILSRMRTPPFPWTKILIAIASMFLIFVFFTHESLKTILVRASSTSEHWQMIKHGFEVLLKNPLGLGLGTVGPASLRFTKFITENWHLQIALEMGFIGFLLFLASLGQIFISLHKKICVSPPSTVNYPLITFLALIGISTAGFFTHSFEETAAMILLWGMIGVISRTKQINK